MQTCLQALRPANQPEQTDNRKPPAFDWTAIDQNAPINPDRPGAKETAMSFSNRSFFHDLKQLLHGDAARIEEVYQQRGVYDRAMGGLLALACGDALANGYEHSPRGSYRITDMQSAAGAMPPGQWSDDTGQALCLADSLFEQGGFDAHDQMRRYVALYEDGEGWPQYPHLRLTPGHATRQALQRFQSSGDPFSGSTHPLTAGNGGLMRLLPVVLATFPSRALTRAWARESTRTTHGADDCLEASELLALILHRLLEGDDRDAVLRRGAESSADPLEWMGGEAFIRSTRYHGSRSSHKPPPVRTRPLLDTLQSQRLRSIARGSYLRLREGQIRSKAYVVDTLEAALWCFATTDTLEAAILRAANLGDDCDTVAAVTGQLAGCCYGAGAIPREWLEALVDADAISSRAVRLLGTLSVR